MSGATDNSLLQIAHVLKSNGTDGELVLGFRDYVPEDIEIEEPVFIFDDGLPVPFFFESFKKKGQSKALVRLTGVGSLEDAEELCGKAVYGEKETYELEEEIFENIVGWTLLDAEGTKVGMVTDYEDIPGNPCIYVQTPSGQGMIPLHEDLVLEMDDEKRTIMMEIPDGLLD